MNEVDASYAEAFSRSLARLKRRTPDVALAEDAFQTAVLKQLQRLRKAQGMLGAEIANTPLDEDSKSRLVQRTDNIRRCIQAKASRHAEKRKLGVEGRYLEATE